MRAAGRSPAISGRARFPPPALLAPVHRLVGVPNQGGRLLGVGRKEADADAGVDGHLAVRDDEGDAKAVVQALSRGRGHLHRLSLPDAAAVGLREVEQDQELVPAVAGEDVLGADAVAEPLRHLPQQLVTGVVAEGLVDRLDPVEVEVEHREMPAVPGGARDRHLEMTLEERALGPSHCRSTSTTSRQGEADPHRHPEQRIRHRLPLPAGAPKGYVVFIQEADAGRAANASSTWALQARDDPGHPRRGLRARVGTLAHRVQAHDQDGEPDRKVTVRGWHRDAQGADQPHGNLDDERISEQRPAPDPHPVRGPRGDGRRRAGFTNCEARSGRSHPARPDQGAGHRRGEGRRPSERGRVRSWIKRGSAPG